VIKKKINTIELLFPSSLSTQSDVLFVREKNFVPDSDFIYHSQLNLLNYGSDESPSKFTAFSKENEACSPELPSPSSQAPDDYFEDLSYRMSIDVQKSEELSSSENAISISYIPTFHTFVSTLINFINKKCIYVSISNTNEFIVKIPSPEIKSLTSLNISDSKELIIPTKGSVSLNLDDSDKKSYSDLRKTIFPLKNRNFQNSESIFKSFLTLFNINMNDFNAISSIPSTYSSPAPKFYSFIDSQIKKSSFLFPSPFITSTGSAHQPVPISFPETHNDLLPFIKSAIPSSVTNPISANMPITIPEYSPEIYFHSKLSESSLLDSKSSQLRSSPNKNITSIGPNYQQLLHSKPSFFPFESSMLDSNCKHFQNKVHYVLKEKMASKLTMPEIENDNIFEKTLIRENESSESKDNYIPFFKHSKAPVRSLLSSPCETLLLSGSDHISIWSIHTTVDKHVADWNFSHYESKHKTGHNSDIIPIVSCTPLNVYDGHKYTEIFPITDMCWMVGGTNEFSKQLLPNFTEEQKSKFVLNKEICNSYEADPFHISKNLPSFFGRYQKSVDEELVSENLNSSYSQQSDALS
jgi:hypothetical protein